MLGVFVWIWVSKWLQEATARPATVAMTHILLLMALTGGALKVWPLLIAPRSTTSISNSSGIQWRPYAEDRVAEAIMAGRGVFVDFTADWCVTCKVNETLVLNTPAFENLLKQYSVITFKGDWTRGDEDVTRGLKKYNGLGVPHYVLVNPANPGKFQVLPTILTYSTLEEAFRSALEKPQKK